MFHVGAREYDPRTARWLQRDPIGVGGGDPNLYLYCHDDPLNRIDPDGLDAGWTERPVLNDPYGEHHLSIAQQMKRRPRYSAFS